jgi:hypothetical protein
MQVGTTDNIGFFVDEHFSRYEHAAARNEYSEDRSFWHTLTQGRAAGRYEYFDDRSCFNTLLYTRVSRGRSNDITAQRITG